MIRRQSDLVEETKLNIRGGVGAARGVDLLKLGEMAGVLSLGRMILEGHGIGVLDGERFPLGPGDFFLVKAGGSHGLINDSEGPLTFLGLLTRSAETA